MRHALRLLLAMMAVWLGMLPSARGDVTPEDASFQSASGELSDKQFHQAELDFSTFLDVYSNSMHAPEAALRKAQAQFAQSNNVGVIETLQDRLPHAGNWAPNYIFYIAKATNALGDIRMAARGFANITKQFPNSPLRLEAAYDEADAWSKLRDWPQVIELLGVPTGAFQTAARAAEPGNEFASSGMLLLSKAYLEENDPAEGETILRGMPTAGLSPEVAWERQYMLCRLALAQNKVEAAEADATNLIATAQNLGSRTRGMSMALKGEILERRGKLPEALACYTNNLTDDRLPQTIQQESLRSALQLMLRQGETNAAAALLEDLAQRPNFKALDVARLGLGEFCLTAYATGDTNAQSYLGTNLLQRAGTNFESVLRDFPASPLRGRAELDDGWRNWAQTNTGAARKNFQEAAELLPHSEEQALARFKLADAEFAERDNTGALSNYQAVIREYHDLPAVTNSLYDLALYKILETSLRLGDEAQANDAMTKIMTWFPASYYGGQGLLKLGEDMTRKDDYATARRDFTKLLEKPTPLKPKAEFAIARTYELEGNWNAALPLFEKWVADYPQNPLLPQVEFEHAQTYDKAGESTNALRLMTNFTARFSTNRLAPWAQNWVADYYYNQGDYENAEKNYEELYVKWPNAEDDLAYLARLNAGKSALGRNDTKEALDYFTHLVDDTTAPPHIVADGYFALGDTFLQQYALDPTNAPVLNAAIAAFSRLTNGPATNAMAPNAFGRLGDAYRQGHDDNGAIHMYQAVLACSSTIDAATRSQAQIAIGKVLLDQKKPDDALGYFDKVLYDSSQTNSYWIVQAGAAAAQICEEQQNWPAAIKIYQRVSGAVPGVHDMLLKKIEAAQAMIDGKRE